MSGLTPDQRLAREYQREYESELAVLEQGRRTRLRLVTAASVSIQRPAWAWDYRIPIAGATLIAGREGMGKTALTVHLIARLTRGQLEGDLHGHSADVVYVGEEDDRASVLVPRLLAAGADLERVHFMEFPESGVPFSLAEDIEELDDLLNALSCAAVVIDPLDSHLGSSVDAHRKAEVQRVIGQLAGVAQRHRCAVVGLAHLNKGDAKDVLARVVGSVGFTTSVRSVIGVGEHPSDDRHRVAVLAKSNLADKASVPALRFSLEGCEVTAEDGSPVPTARVVLHGYEEGIDPHTIVSGLDADARSERDLAVEWLRDLLTDGPVPYREVELSSRDEGISRATLHRAKGVLGVHVERNDRGRGRPSTWSLPPDSVSVLLPSKETKPEGVFSSGGDRQRAFSSQPEVLETIRKTAGARASCTRCGAVGRRLIPHHSGNGAYCPACCPEVEPGAGGGSVGGRS